MSYSITAAKNERTVEMNVALFTRDAATLHRLAYLTKKEGDDQLAHLLKTEANKINREDETEDLNEEKEQRSERENSYREAELYPSE